MDFVREPGCPLHGNGAQLRNLVGRRLEKVIASWHVHGDAAPSGPLDVWLFDSEAAVTRITTGSDWCLIVAAEAPFAEYGMGEFGRVVPVPIDRGTAFAEHVGETITATGEESCPKTGRVALEIAFTSGLVRCESRGGDLHLSGHRTGIGDRADH